MTSIIVFLPLPARELSANARVHWSVIHRATTNARLVSKIEAMKALAGARPPMWKRARMAVKFYMPHLRNDPTNLMRSLKAYEDGLQDAGIVANDRGIWPERPEVVKDSRLKDHPNAAFRRGIARITITPEPEEAPKIAP